jgi:mannose-6-phosphate isomerase-like protein (cupin superfamily)
MEVGILADWSILHLDDVADGLGEQWPGEMKFITYPLGAEQVAITWRRLPKGAGGRGGYGHRHRTQEELYFVVAGTLTFKLGDEEVEVPAGSTVRVPADVVRSVDNDRDEDAELIIVSPRVADPRADAEVVEGFWE